MILSLKTHKSRVLHKEELLVENVQHSSSIGASEGTAEGVCVRRLTGFTVHLFYNVLLANSPS